MSFPTPATSGQTTTLNGVTYTYSTGTNSWTRLNVGASASTTATNIAGGLSGQLTYQTSSGATGFVSTGTIGQVLVSGGIGSPVYQSTLTLAGNASAISTNTGALQVVGGVGIGGNLYVGNTGTFTGALVVGNAVAGVPGEIRATNEITAYYSDRRLKENIQIVDNALDKVLSLTGITYTPNALAELFGYDRNKKLAGLFADEVEAVLPEAVRPAPFDDNGAGGSKSGENYLTVQYEKLIPLLVEAIKEQQQQILQLKEAINTLYSKE